MRCRTDIVMCRAARTVLHFAEDLDAAVVERFVKAVHRRVQFGHKVIVVQQNAGLTVHHLPEVVHPVVSGEHHANNIIGGDTNSNTNKNQVCG